MNSQTVQSQVKTLETQLAVLKAQMARANAGPSARTLGDLYGMLADKGNFSEEEIDKAQYGFDWNGDHER